LAFLVWFVFTCPRLRRGLITTGILATVVGGLWTIYEASPAHEKTNSSNLSDPVWPTEIIGANQLRFNNVSLKKSAEKMATTTSLGQLRTVAHQPPITITPRYLS